MIGFGMGRSLVLGSLTAVAWLLFASSLIAAYAVTNVARECQGGAFSPAFGKGFDIRRCDLVVRIGKLELRAPLLQWMTEMQDAPIWHVKVKRFWPARL